MENSSSALCTGIEARVGAGHWCWPLVLAIGAGRWCCITESTAAVRQHEYTCQNMFKHDNS